LQESYAPLMKILVIPLKETIISEIRGTVAIKFSYVLLMKLKSRDVLKHTIDFIELMTFFTLLLTILKVPLDEHLFYKFGIVS
jgi:hypothetical protein